MGWILLLSRAYWRERAGLVMTDDLLLLFYALALLGLLGDPKLERRSSPWLFGLWVGLAVMTKWFAGLLPFALLLWTRPALSRLGLAVTAALAVAAPWHIYQLLINREWFLAEYLGVELFTYALSAPVQASGESAVAFYLSRSAWLLPAVAVAAFALARRRAHSLALVWCAVLLSATFAYGYHNASYLLPLAPALLLVHRGWLSWPWLPLAALFSFGPPVAPAYTPTREFEGREVLHLDVNDQFRTSLAAGCTVRYLLFLPHLPPNGPLDFERIGIARPWQSFLAAPLAQVDVVLTPDLASLQALLDASPTRDFVLPGPVMAALIPPTSHRLLPYPGTGKVHLQSLYPRPGPRPNRFPSPTPVLAK